MTRITERGAAFMIPMDGLTFVSLSFPRVLLVPLAPLVLLVLVVLL